MPRGISRAKHPEMYASAPGTKAAPKTNYKAQLTKSMKTVAKAATPFKRGTRQLGSKRQAKTETVDQQQNGIHLVASLTQYFASLVSVRATDQANDVDDLDQEIGDTFQILRSLRKEVYGEPPQQAQTEQSVETHPPITATPPAAPTAQPPFVAPPAPVATAPAPA